MNLTFTTTPGKVTLLNASGDDTTIVNAAIVSYSYTGQIDPEKKHERLFDEMFRSGHWGTLDHCFVTFKIECPIFVARQIMRSSNMHFNEISMRYLESDGKCYIPKTFWKDVNRKELGGDPEAMNDQHWVEYYYKDAVNESFASYHAMLETGVRKEQARDVLPVGMYTAFWVSACLSDWFHFLNLRLDKHAQYETWFVADLILQELMVKYPESCRLWWKYARGPINEHGTIQTP